MKEMQKKQKWNDLASRAVVNKTIAALEKNGISAEFVEDGNAVREKFSELVPKGYEIMNMTSMTLESLGIAKKILESGEYDSVRKKLLSMDKNSAGRETQKLGAAPGYAVGSLHAVTEDGVLVIASATGSQLPAYAFGSEKVIFIAGTQKIVTNLDAAMKRVYDYVLPLESERAKKAYGVAGSNVNKMLIINKEFQANRIHVIFVNEKLGF